MNVAIISSWHVHTREYTEALYKMPSVNITAFWDEDKAVGEKWAEEFNCKFVENYDDILADKSIDGIMMTAKTSMHGEMLLKAAKAGKHIFTEKVLALTSDECYAIRDEIVKNNLKFTISYPHQCRADVQFAKRMLDENLLGNITYGRIRNAHDGSSAGWLPEHFYDEAQCGGGAMMDLGAHPMYLLAWFLGNPVNIVSCFTKVTDRAVEDNAVSVLEFARGTIGVSETGFVSESNPFTLELSGTDGSLMIHGDHTSYANRETDGKWVDVTEFPPAWPMPLEQWVGSIDGTVENHLDIEAAVQLTRLMEGAYSSQKTGKKYNF